MRSSSGVFRNYPVQRKNSGLIDLTQSPTLDLSMLNQIPVSESDLDSNIDSDKVSTASGSTPIISDKSDGSNTPSINGDLSDPAGSDVPEISSDVSDKHSECGSVETNSVIQEVNSEEELRLSEVNVNKVSVGVNTEQDVNPSENPAVNQVNYGGNEPEINPTKSNANFDSVDYKQFDPNEFIRFLLESIERSRLALKSLRRKLLGKIEL